MSSLRRVSSRQRLVSWDAFDATVYYDSTEEEEVCGGNDTRQSRVVVSSTNSASPQATATSPISHPTTTIDGTNHMLRSDRHNTNVAYGSLNKNNVDTVAVVVVNEDSSDTDDSGVDVTRKRRLYDTTTSTTTSSSTTNGNTTTLPSHSHRTTSNTIQERHDDHHYLHVIPASPTPPPTTTAATTTTTSTHTYYAPYLDATTAGTSPTTTGEVLLWQLPLEVQCMMYQYLNVKELRTVTQVCTTLRHSLLLLLPHPDHMHHNDDDDDGIETEDEERNCIVESALWRPLCIHQFWPFLQPTPSSSSSSSSDPLPPSQSPLILSITPRSHSPYHHHHPSITRNFPLLLSMAVSKIPTHIDTSLFPYTRPSRSATRSGHLQVLAELLESQTFTIAPMPQPMSLQPKMISMNCTITTTTTTTSNHNSSSIATVHEDCRRQNHQVIQFIGKVGFGDQCIRSNAPLPRPKRIQSPTPTSYTTSTTTKWNLPYHPFHPSTTSSSTSSLFQRVFRNSSHGSGMNSTGTTNNTTAATATMLRENSIGTQNTTTTTGSTSLFCPLRRSVRIATRRESASSASYSSATATRVPPTMTIPYRPFCVPFMTSNYEINIAPRYIAYYEVTILPKCNHGDKCETTTATIQHIRSTNGQQTTITKSIQYPPDTSATTTTNHRHGTATLPPNHHNRNNTTSTVSDCVAVGIGTENFPLQHRMPGWDSHSYGYHGDDGGIFHGNGSMIQPYHRPFGVNDTIGCGIDYIQNSIFFTLNGIFLGYAFPLLPKHRDIDLYPMIGMDTQYPILCNFGGTAPFVFDLPSMIQQHDTIIQEQLTI